MKGLASECGLGLGTRRRCLRCPAPMARQARRPFVISRLQAVYRAISTARQGTEGNRSCTYSQMMGGVLERGDGVCAGESLQVSPGPATLPL